MSKYNLVDIFEGMSSDEMSKAQEADRLKDHPERDTIKKIQALMAKEKSVEEGSEQAIDPAEYGDIGQNYLAGFGKENTLDLDSLEKLGRKIVKQLYKGDFAAAKAKFIKEDAIEDEPVTEGNEAVDLAIEASQKKAGIKEDQYDDITDADDDIPADKKKEAALAYRKVDKGASYEKATSHIKEVRIDDEVADRIEGLTNRELKRKFLFAFEDLYSDLIEEDPFHAEDVIAHLSNEMNKHLSSFQNTGDKFAGIEEKDAVNFNMKADADYDEGLEDIEESKPGYNEDGTPKSNDEMGDDEREDFYNNLDSVDEGSIDKVSMKDVVLALIKDAKGTNPEIDSYVKSLKQAGDKFDSVDDYVEDFKEYVSNKSLQEHFGRFMKDYQ